jgi:hypothetical protein
MRLMALRTSKDVSGQDYIAIPLGNEEAIRITRVQRGWMGRPTVRVQFQQADNKVRPGPDIPFEMLTEVIAAMQQLAME